MTIGLHAELIIALMRRNEADPSSENHAAMGIELET